MKPYVSEAVDFESTGTISQSDVPVFIQWHGNYILYQFNSYNNSNVNSSLNKLARLMIIGWLGLVSIGITMARHFRNDWPEKDVLGTKIWFTVS